VDYSGEPTTLVTFELVEVAEGTQLTITESGFDGIPLHRRGSAFEMNANGWAAQVRLSSPHWGTRRVCGWSRASRSAVRSRS
jgi:hypothetical protein